ncbi:hypothetical protein [Methylobacterium sp. J-070]|uniref:hypothetical protein n=1 Tax=Methylobacterium sp. J-070 TaxID=2836650 RepID=UPI001FBBC641|nr:hypothetical protein [Methylobacterium sp. J-070]MCJ2051679.1 hypothetical protein [Methylobacterium sp. J-070]
MADADRDDGLNDLDPSFELLRQACLTLAQGLVVQMGEEGQRFVRRLDEGIQKAAAAQSNTDFDRAAKRVRAVLQEALDSG